MSSRASPPIPSSRGISISVNRVAVPVSQITQNPTISIIAYCVASISMTIVNKYCVSGPQWNMNFLLLAFQSTICIIAIQSCKSAGLISSLSAFSTTKAKKWFPIALLLVLMTYTGMKSLQYLSVPVYTIFKNLTIIVIAYGEVLWFGAHVSSSTLLSFGVMVLSSIVAAWADIRSAMQATYDRGLVVTEEKKDDGSWGLAKLGLVNVGYAWMAVNVLCTAAYVLGMRRVIKKMSFKDWDTMYYNNLLTIPILVLSSILFEDWSFANLALNFPSTSRNGQITAMVYSGLTTISISYASAWCIRVTSSTTYSMVGALNKLPIAVSGLVFFGTPVTIGGVVAILMAFVSGIMYTWSKAKQGEKEKRDEREKAMVLPTRERRLSLGARSE